MTHANRDVCFKHVGAAEGGYSNRALKDDPGGPTKYGVTAKTLGAYRELGRRATAEEVKALTKAEAVEIYAANYWYPCGAEELPAGLDLAVFDYAINSGPGQAVEELQRVVGAPVDGVWGDETGQAVGKADVAKAINDLCDRRKAFMKRLKNFKANPGWWPRVEHIRAVGLAMAEGAKPPKPVALPPEQTGKAPPAAEKLLAKPEIQAAAGGGIVTAAAAAKEIGGMVKVAAEPVAKHAGDGFIGHVATFLLLLLVAYALASIAYRVWRQKQEAKGAAQPASLLGKINQVLSGFSPAEHAQRHWVKG